MPRQTRFQAFTLIELMIVIVIIIIITTSLSHLHRGRIQQLNALQQKTQRLHRHRTSNRQVTTTRFLNNIALSSFQRVYKKDNSTFTIQDGSGNIIEEYQSNLIATQDLILQKKPLGLGCDTDSPSSSPTTLTLLHPPSEKRFCFTLNTSLCNWSPCL